MNYSTDMLQKASTASSEPDSGLNKGKFFRKITGGQEQTDAAPEYPEAAPDASNDGIPLVEDHVLMFYR